MMRQLEMYPDISGARLEEHHRVLKLIHEVVVLLAHPPHQGLHSCAVRDSLAGSIFAGMSGLSGASNPA